jgi:hypothetical protein
MAGRGLFALGLLGGLALLGSKAKAATLPAAPFPPSPPAPPPPPPHARPVASNPPPHTVVPAGWIPVRPGDPVLDETAKEIAALNGAIGTSYPFQLGDKNYVAKTVAIPGGKTVVILQPDNQL